MTEPVGVWEQPPAVPPRRPRWRPYNQPPVDREHVVTIRKQWCGDRTAACSCGWSAENPTDHDIDTHEPAR